MSKYFPAGAPAAAPTYNRTYARGVYPNQEDWSDTCKRVVEYVRKMGNLSNGVTQELYDAHKKIHLTAAGRILWVGGTTWIEEQRNYPGVYNCSSRKVEKWADLGECMLLLSMGVGVGMDLTYGHNPPSPERWFPAIVQIPEVEVLEGWETMPPIEDTTLSYDEEESILTMVVGDSKEGWANSYTYFLSAFSDTTREYKKIVVDLRGVREQGKPIKGFGGVSQPSKLPDLYRKARRILQEALGRIPWSTEIALLASEAALVIVAGNVRRSAMIFQFAFEDMRGKEAKLNLWQQTPDGKWQIDPLKDAFRMGNHTRVCTKKPSWEEVLEGVTLQHQCGEGAIQWAGEALARANADLLPTPERKKRFLDAYSMDQETGRSYLRGLLYRRIEEESRLPLSPEAYFKNEERLRSIEKELTHRMERYGLNPCGEILGKDFFCDLFQIHMELLPVEDFDYLRRLCQLGAMGVCSLLSHEFLLEELQESREYDPIVAVTITGLFDYLIKLFGESWLKWWMAGRPNNYGPLLAIEDQREIPGREREECQLSEYFLSGEVAILSSMREWVNEAVTLFCNERGLQRPNRVTSVQPCGTKALLSGGGSGWGPSKGQYWIRRITMAKNSPITMACLLYGYSIIPAQSCKDEEGKILTDIQDPRVTEVLVEIPCRVPWADDVEGEYDIHLAPIHSQWSLLQQVQRNFSEHNTSSTLEVFRPEVEELARYIYDAIQNDEGMVSTTIMERDYLLAGKEASTFPFMPFAPISREEYEKKQAEVLERRRCDTFDEAIELAHTQGGAVSQGEEGARAPACSGVICERPASLPPS